MTNSKPDSLNTSKITDYAHHGEYDAKSDDSTKKADQIIRNIDINKLWADIDPSTLSEKEQPEFGIHDDEELSEIEPKQRVETISEEIEPDSNISTVVENSAIKEPEKVDDYGPDQMDLGGHTKLGLKYEWFINLLGLS